jgi:hypothetical protein
MCLRFQCCTHQRVCILYFLKKSQIHCTFIIIKKSYLRIKVCFPRNKQYTSMLYNICKSLTHKDTEISERFINLYCKYLTKKIMCSKSSSQHFHEMEHCIYLLSFMHELKCKTRKKLKKTLLEIY